MMAEEERAIDRRMRRAVKQLKRTEPGWKDMTKMQRLDRAAAMAGDSFATELEEFRMDVPAKSKPLSEDVRKAEADRQQRMVDQGFTIKAVRGVRFVRRQGNPEDGELTGGRWFTDRPDTANTYSGQAGGDMATASMKVRIRLRNPLVVDAQGKRFDQIPRSSLPEDVQKQAIRGKLLSTDDIADAARLAEGNYDGIIFKNLKDDLTSNAITTKPATVYAVFDRKNIRSEFAQFDPEFSEMPGLLYQTVSGKIEIPDDVDLNRFGLSDRQMSVAQLILDGVSFNETADTLGLTYTQVKGDVSQARKKGVPFPDFRANRTDALANTSPERLRSLYIEGMTQAEIGEALSVDQKTAGRALNKLKDSGIITQEDEDAAQKARESRPKKVSTKSDSALPARGRGYVDGDMRFEPFYDKRLSERDNKVVEMARNGAGIPDMAEEWGIAERTVHLILKSARDMGIDIPYAAASVGTPVMDRVLRLEQKGLTASQIAELTGMNKAAVYETLRRAADAGLYTILRDRITSAFDQGYSVAEIAAQTNRYPGTVRWHLWQAGRINKPDNSTRYEAPQRKVSIAAFGGPSLLFQTVAPTYYSALTNFVAASQQPKAPASQWKAILSKAPGVKAEEIEWTGVNDWLDAQEGSVTREDLVAFLEQNGVKVEEVVKGAPIGDQAAQVEAIQRELLPLIEERDQISAQMQDAPPSDHKTINTYAREMQLPREDQSVQDAYYSQPWAARRRELIDRSNALTRQIDDLRNQQNAVSPESQTQWSSWTLPGGENYREMLLTLPAPTETARYKELSDRARKIATMRLGDVTEDGRTVSEVRDEIYAEQEAMKEQSYTSSHWSEPNVLAHVRFKERVTADGQRTLALEEIQSDWHQAGRKRGYASAEAKAAVDKATADGIAARSEMIASLTDPSVVEKINARGTSSEKEMLAMVQRGMHVTDQHLRTMLMNFFRDPSLPDGVGARMNAAIKAYEASDAAYRAAQRAMQSGVPNAPFKNNAWANLVLKRMIRWAAENGFDSVSWIPGNIQNGQEVDAEDGRSDFYDKIIPNLANKLGKPYGARVEKVRMDEPQIAPDTMFWSLPITDEMRTAALEKGFALFQRGDPKGWGETTPPPDLPPMRLNLAYTRDAYGDDAVKRLPAPIRERAASGSSVDSMMDVVRAVKKTLKRKPPKTLTKWINAKRRGYGKSTVSSPTAKGINGIKGAADELRAMGLEKLINEKSGTDLDYVREAAIEDGFLPEGATVNDLLAAMDAERRGEPTYSRHDEAEVLDLQAAEAWEKMFDDAGINIFEDSDKELRKKLSGFVSSQNEDAVTPDQAAEQFGFGSGEELLNALANIGNRERHIAEQVRREMAAEFGDPFNDGTLTEKARVMAESELRARAGEIELEALARAVGEVAATRMAKEMARDTLQMLTVKELSSWRRYLQAERREMQNAMDAVKRGDTVQAFIHKRRQMVNMHLAREGEKLFEQIEKQRKDLQKYETSKTRRDRIAGDYLEKIDDLLEHYELRVSKQGPKEQRRRMSAALWVKQMIEEGREAEIPAEANLLAELADTKVWRDLTAEEVEYLVGTVKNLAHLGRLKNRLISDREQRKFAAVRSELVDRLRAAPSTRNRAKAFSPTIAQKAMSWLRESDAKLTKIEDQLAMMDGQENGPLFNFFAQPFNEQDVAKLVEIKKLTRALTAAYNRMPGRMQRTLQKRVATPELALPNDTPMTLFDAIIIGLNFGNQGNRDALVAGYGWELNTIESMLDRVLPTEAWDFIEDVWSIVNSYRDAAFALHKDITGVEPKAVDPIKFKLSSGREIAGGYYPLKYDGDQARADSVIVRKMSEKEMLNELGMSFTKPMTKTGHLISRIGSGGKPVKISIDVLHEHLENVVHDIFFRRAVIDAHKMIKDPEFTQAYIDAAGKDQYDRLMPWLTDIATNNKAKLTGTFNKNMKAVRSNISLWLMGYKFGTAVQQLTGFMEALPEIGPRYMIQGMAKAYASGPRSFWESWNFIRERSEYLSTRVTFGKDRDIRAITTNVGNRTPYRALKENGFIFLSLMDAGIGTAVWRGAFDRAMDGHTNGINAGDEEAAIAYADQVVRRALTSGETHQLPEIMRGSELDKFVTSIYSYGSKQYNRTRHKTYQVRYGQIGWPEYIASMFIMHAMVPIVAAILAGRFWPWPDDDEDPEDVASAAATEVYMNAVGMIPVFRDLASAFLKPQYGYQMSPVQSGVEKIIGASRRAAEGESFTSEYAARELLDAFSVAFGLPGQQLWITGDYVWDVMEGEEHPMEDPVDAAREALLRNER